MPLKQERNKKNKEKQPLILFAIPSFNEAENIGLLTRVIDLGLSRYFKNAEAAIVNTDNDSSDSTKQVFLQTPTKHKKIYLTSRGKPLRLRGKGYHMRLALELAKKMNADAIGFIDGDVSSARPEWVRDLITPLFQGYDTVLPAYLRNEYDGSITNHFVYPLVSGFLLTNIRQPIAGEIGLSRQAVNLLLSEKWYPSANHFGVDIYFLTQSIFKELRIAQTFIGIKDHKPSSPKLDSMFIQVADSLIYQLVRYRRFWQNKNWKGRKAPIVKPMEKIYHTPELPFDYKYLKKRLSQECQSARSEIIRFFGNSLGKRLVCSFGKAPERKINMPKELWLQAVCRAISKNRLLTPKEFLAFRAVFFARFLSFYKEVIEKTHQEAELEIIGQAKLFRKMRKDFIA